ncbi:MAG: hypothetical protein WA821_06565 [Anaerolineales bacterium]
MIKKGLGVLTLSPQGKELPGLCATARRFYDVFAFLPNHDPFPLSVFYAKSIGTKIRLLAIIKSSSNWWLKLITLNDYSILNKMPGGAK